MRLEFPALSREYLSVNVYYCAADRCSQVRSPQPQHRQRSASSSSLLRSLERVSEVHPYAVASPVSGHVIRRSMTITPPLPIDVRLDVDHRINTALETQITGKVRGQSNERL
jgi:hypothetical protein